MQANVYGPYQGAMSTFTETISWVVIEWFLGCGTGNFLAGSIFVDYGQGIFILPVINLVLSCHRIPEKLASGNSLSEGDDAVFTGKSPLCWDTTEEEMLISSLHLIRLVDI